MRGPELIMQIQFKTFHIKYASHKPLKKIGVFATILTLSPGKVGTPAAVQIEIACNRPHDMHVALCHCAVLYCTVCSVQPVHVEMCFT